MRLGGCVVVAWTLVGVCEGVFRQLSAHHKTGVWYARDIGNISCTVFGYDSDACWRSPLDWVARCHRYGPGGTPCTGKAPLVGLRRRVKFFREPFATVVSAYLYHNGGGGGTETWTTTPISVTPRSDKHYKQLQAVRAGGFKNGYPLRARRVDRPKSLDATAARVQVCER